jgi:hypothetical protein
MTAQEIQAIQLLNDHLKTFIEENRVGHQDIKDFIKDVEVRLTKKVDDRGADIRAITQRCKERQIEVDAMLARGLVTTDAHIAAAQLAAVAEATRPSAWSIVTKGLANFAVKLVAFCAAVGAVVIAVHHFWG